VKAGVREGKFPVTAGATSLPVAQLFSFRASFAVRPSVVYRRLLFYRAADWRMIERLFTK